MVWTPSEVSVYSRCTAAVAACGRLTNCTLYAFDTFRMRCHFVAKHSVLHLDGFFFFDAYFCLRSKIDGFSSITWYHRCWRVRVYICWRFSLISSLFHSLVLVTLFIFCITTFYITFIRMKKTQHREKYSDVMAVGICVRFLFFFIYQLFRIRTMDFFVFFLYFRYCLRLSCRCCGRRLRKIKPVICSFTFSFWSKSYIFLCACISTVFVEARAHTMPLWKIKLQEMTRAVETKIYGLLFFRHTFVEFYVELKWRNDR